MDFEKTIGRLNDQCGFVGAWMFLHWKILLAGILCVIVASVAATYFLVKETDFVKVSGFSWQRKIDIEQYRTVHDSQWDYAPAGAYNIYHDSHHYRRTDSKSVCIGTGKNKKCHEESYSVYDDWYSYDIDRWIYDYSLVNVGSLKTGVVWPDKIPSVCSPLIIGCLRVPSNGRSEQYTVDFLTQKNETLHCNFSQDVWSSYQINSDWALQIGTYSRIPDCASLRSL